MDSFIEEKLQQVFDDFKSEYARVGCLCKAKTLTYEAGNIPDYRVPLIQQYYNLRYMPAYLAEYYLMYTDLLDREFLELDRCFKVLSLGCGCGVDYWGLHLSLLRKGYDAKDVVYYTGIDIMDWMYRDDIQNTDVTFSLQDISDIDPSNLISANIIIFPKSIGEISKSGFDNLCNLFRSISFKKRKICLLCSIMKERNTQTIDGHRLMELANILEDKGYSSNDQKDEFTEYLPKGIRSVCKDFIYPQDIINHLNNLSSYCPKYVSHGGKSCKRDCSSLNRSPILKTDYMKYMLLCYER